VTIEQLLEAWHESRGRLLYWLEREWDRVRDEIAVIQLRRDFHAETNRIANAITLLGNGNGESN